MGELVFMALLCVMGVACFIDTLHFRVSLLDRSGGAAVFPRVVIVLLLLLVCIRIVMILRDGNRPHFVFLEAFAGARLAYLIALAALVFTIKPIGFLPAMSAFMLFTANYFYFRTHGSLGKAWFVILRSVSLVAFVAVVYYFFTGVLHVMLPAGLLG